MRIGSDHGYQNGEKGQWCKTTTFELANRIPMFVVAPESLGSVRAFWPLFFFTVLSRFGLTSWV